MSKMLSEAEIEKAFNEYELNINWPNAFMDHRSSAFDAFKAAFTLLMPIIEKQANELEFYASGDAHDSNDSWVEYYENGHIRFATGKRARRALQETKQMLKKLPKKLVQI